MYIVLLKFAEQAEAEILEISQSRADERLKFLLG